MMATHRPTALRLAGFLATALGGLLVGLGSVMTWATVALGTSTTLAPLETKGIDVAEGRIALAAGALMLIAIPAMRLSGRTARRAWASLVVVAALAAGGLALSAAARADGRLGLGAAEDEARRISEETGLPYDALLAKLQEVTAVEVQPAIYLVVAGGVVGALGGALGLVWAGRKGEIEALRPPDDEVSGS